MIKVRAIKTEQDYEIVLAEIEALMDAEPDTPDGDRLDVLTALVDAYEAKHHPIDLPDPIEAIKVRMEELGVRRKDLEAIIGSKSKVSEVLSGKRPLSIAMIRRLHSELGIPAEVLIQEAGSHGKNAA
ncbi:MAG TPA: transcriptional regulator [Dongiaceae bacterium]|nr:transcriptional regulator [Dongiaceae bacterium]